MASILVRLFEHHRWANLRAVAACAGLADAQLDASVHGTAGSVRETLLHLAGAEQRYAQRLSGREPTYNERDDGRWPGAERLRQALGDSGRALIELAGRADSDERLTLEHRAGPTRCRPRPSTPRRSTTRPSTAPRSRRS